MNSVQNHIIEKIIFEVHTKDENKATDINNSASSYLRNKVFLALDELLSKYDSIEQTLRFESLSIDCRIRDWNNIDELKIALSKKLEQEISKVQKNDSKHAEIEKDIIINDKDKRIIADRENSQSTFLYFLENGYLPWSGKKDYIDEITKPLNWNKNLEQAEFSQNLKKLLSEKSTSRERFVIQFSNEVVLSVLESFQVLKLKNRSGFLIYLNELEFKFKANFLKMLLELSLNYTAKSTTYIELVNIQISASINVEISADYINDFLLKLFASVKPYFGEKTIKEFFQLSNDEIKYIRQQCLKRNAVSEPKKEALRLSNADFENSSTIISQESVTSEKEKEPLYFKSDENEIIIQNAGLVLFFPFLQKLLERINCLNKQKQIKHWEREKAVQVLSFLTNGNDDYFEGNLMLEKYLCGVTLNFPIAKNSYLSDEIKNECNIVLQSLINNWQALKNTSPSGLRQMFVQRPGKLIKIERGFRLIVERKVQDILLEKLPWNIAIVKLPWMDDLLFVEW